MSRGFRTTSKARRNRLPLFRPLRLLMFVALFSSIACFYLIDLRIHPAIAAGAKATGLRASHAALNRALDEELTSDAAMADIVNLNRDIGTKTAIFDFAAVSKVQSNATRLAEDYLSDLEQETFHLPLGQTLGGALFSSLGPPLPIHVRMIGSAHSSVDIQTKTVGINQTVHVLVLKLSADVQVIAPTVSEPATVAATVPIAYVVFNGDVPNTYFGNRPPVSYPYLPSRPTSP